MRKPLIVTFSLAAVVSAAAWLYGYRQFPYLYRWNDVWFHLIAYIVPPALLAATSWIAWHRALWRKLLGGIMLVPSLGIWMLYLLLAANAFRIH